MLDRHWDDFDPMFDRSDAAGSHRWSDLVFDLRSMSDAAFDAVDDRMRLDALLFDDPDHPLR